MVRLQRWAITLSAYQHYLRYHTAEHSSRLFLKIATPVYSPEGKDKVVALYTLHLENFPVSGVKIAEGTVQDSILYLVVEYVCTGWPSYYR